MKKENIKKEWYLMDAKGKILGRLATKAASLLYGKGKKNFLPNIDNGDYVVIINAKDIKVTGKKMSDKIYYRHTGYPGGIKKEALKDLLARKPEEVIKKAIKGMLPKNKLQKKALGRLRIYKDENHGHGEEELKQIETK